MIRMQESALAILRTLLGEQAAFRPGQWESIESVLNRRRTLVVQKTGWGKSIVYFIATRILRDRGNGPTILISPLLSLMRNQIDNARRIGIRAETINSDNEDEWERVEHVLQSGTCDILLLSPERLGNEDFTARVLPRIKDGIGMFVVDEAHCISDWGHDFRPDYRRIVRLVKTLPPNVPVLATTATANLRVVEDINEQLGNDLTIVRGPLTRESLRLQIIKLADQAERLAWLREHISSIEGSGIIYCLTTADCGRVARWLRGNGVNALEYHAQLSEDPEETRRLRIERENMLMDNKVKALVATVALGMGYDKPDLAFVIHFQRPGSLVEYYQQIGRAGRALDRAYAILLNGREDDEIREYFISKAFPTQHEMSQVVAVLENSEKGLKETEMLRQLNMSVGRLRNCLKMLMIDAVIAKEGSIYSRTLHPFQPDLLRSERVRQQRYHELDRIRAFVEIDTCYMRFIAQELDDPQAAPCGICCNCTGRKFFPESVEQPAVAEAVRFLRGEALEIVPRKMWPAGIEAPTRKKIPESEQNQAGKVLCTYGDAGWGRFVREDKYIRGCFRDELVTASADLIRDRWSTNTRPTWVTAVPSLRHPELVAGFARRVAKTLNLPYHDAIRKVRDTPEQKTMQNSYRQCRSALDGFEVAGVIAHQALRLR